MQARFRAAGALTLAGLLLVSSARAGDTYRLSIPGSASAPTLNLKATPADLEAETLPTFHRGGFRGGYYGGFRGGYYGGFRGGYYGGYRGGYYGGFRGYYPRYSGGFYGGYYPRYYGGYYGGYGGYGYPVYSSYYLATPGYYGSSYYQSYAYPAPCVVPMSSGTVIQSAPQTMPRTLDTAPQTMPTIPAPNGGGTYPYDGGPKDPIPAPQPDEVLTRALPRIPTQMDTLEVSVKPAQEKGKWVYPAYGESARRTNGK